MLNLQPHKAGLALGLFFGGFHFLWSLLVALGWAQGLLDFIFRIHMIEPAYMVSSFDASLALTLIIVTSVIGYVFGYAFVVVWNKIYR